MKISPATPRQERELAEAIATLKRARAAAAGAGCPALLRSIRGALKSADGARRHMGRRRRAAEVVGLAWSDADQERACRAGWGVFNFDTSGGRLRELSRPEIQRIDDAGVFASDEEAVEHVRKQAARSATARRALKVCNLTW